MEINLKNRPQDLKQFILNLKRNLGGIFAPNREIYISRAPARLDVMGGIGDYSGSIVLESTLKEATIVAVQARHDRRIVIRNLNLFKDHIVTEDFLLDDLFPNGSLKSFEKYRREFADSEKSWTAYIIGVLIILLQQGLMPSIEFGITIAVSSTIPIGAGVSSSAALEVASMLAIQKAYHIPVDSLQTARICQMAENHIVGAPCGIMDQVTSALGREGELLVLKCQPHEVLKMLALPKNLQLVGINSAVKHSVGGVRYRNTRTAAFMGRKIIFDKAHGFLNSDEYDRYLSNISPSTYTRDIMGKVPKRMSGKDFIQTYKSHEDEATRIDPDKHYFIRRATEHPILENARVVKYIELLENYNGSNEEDLIAAGKLMYESHESYSKNCGLGCKETDLLVKLTSKQGAEHGLYGAKITGGGSGGTVAVLAAKGVDDLIKNIASQYFDATGLEPDLFWGTSAGALETGIVTTLFD